MANLMHHSIDRLEVTSQTLDMSRQVGEEVRETMGVKSMIMT